MSWCDRKEIAGSQLLFLLRRGRWIRLTIEAGGCGSSGRLDCQHCGLHKAAIAQQDSSPSQVWLSLISPIEPGTLARLALRKERRPLIVLTLYLLCTSSDRESLHEPSGLVGFASFSFEDYKGFAYQPFMASNSGTSFRRDKSVLLTGKHFFPSCRGSEEYLPSAS
jgi:hypothetical protein